MSLRGRPIEERRELPDGRVAVVWVGVPQDDYVDRKELDTVTLEVHVDGELTASLNTVLQPEQDSEARALALEILRGLESGTLEPTAAAIEPLADSLR